MLGPYFSSDDFYLEAFQTDENRVRMVPNSGKPGRWFSRLRHTNDHGYLEVPEFAFPEDYKEGE